MADPVYCMAIPVSKAKWPGCVAQSVGHLTCKSEVLGLIPGLASLILCEKTAGYVINR